MTDIDERMFCAILHWFDMPSGSPAKQLAADALKRNFPDVEPWTWRAGFKAYLNSTYAEAARGRARLLDQLRDGATIDEFGQCDACGGIEQTTFIPHGPLNPGGDTSVCDICREEADGS